MRNVFALAGLAVMAAAVVVLGDGGHPYQYETSAGWGDHHHNALVTSRQSPNPLRSRQALAALLTPGVAAAIASLATAIGVSTAQATAANNRIDDTNRRVGTTESDITKLKKTDTAEAAKVTALEAAVGSATSGLIKDVTELKASAGTSATEVANLKTNVGDSNSGLTKKVADNCAKVNAILDVTELQATDASLAAVSNFQLTKLVVGGGTATGTVDINGASLNAAVSGGVGVVLVNLANQAAASNTGVTAEDFERYRDVADKANLALQAKIDEILRISTLTC